MENVVVERRFGEPLTVEGVRALAAAKAWCHDRYHARFRRTHLGGDGMRMLCVYAAPDVESVRQASRTGGIPFERAWGATVHGPGEPEPGAAARTLVIVERSFPAAVAFGDVQELEDRAAWCFRMHDVRFHVSYLSRDGRRMICVYEAPDAESVRIANERGALPFDAVWPATLLTF
jgi:hypothetical protein